MRSRSTGTSKPLGTRSLAQVLTQDRGGFALPHVELDVYGRPAGLPRVYSPHRGYWFFGSPPESAVNVLHVGEPGPLAECFRSAEQLGTVESELVNIPQGVPVTLYRDREQSWQVLWPRLRTM